MSHKSSAPFHSINYGKKNSTFVESQHTTKHADQDSRILEIRGSVDRVVFHNRENGYSVIRVSLSDSDEKIVIAGIASVLTTGDHITARGTYTQHPKFGHQFKAEYIHTFMPQSEDGLKRYLGSGAIKGIGPKLASKIIAHFGDQTDTILNNEPERLKEVSGIGAQKLSELSNAFREGGALRAIIQFLTTHGISLQLAQKIYKRYGDDAVRKLQTDPYILARDLKGIGFVKADRIAVQHLGIEHDSPLRLRAALIFALEEAARQGHCYLTRNELITKAGELASGLDLSEPTLDNQLVELISMGKVVQVGDRLIYLRQLNDAEDFVAQFLKRQAKPIDRNTELSNKVTGTIQAVQRHLKLSFSSEQLAAINQAFSYQAMVITGGPGSGKTTLVRAIVAVAQEHGLNITLAAPTGRAANRLANVCGHEAKTIHRLLKYQNGSFFHGSEQPIDTDILIVDETSMVDISLAAALFCAVPEKATVILVGDKDQLPSVGPGRVFADVVESNSLPCVRLSAIYRQAEESEIITTAHSINAGRVPSLTAFNSFEGQQVHFLKIEEPEHIGMAVEILICQDIKSLFGYELDQILLLTPSNLGPLGVEVFNGRLQARLNPESYPGFEIASGNEIFRLGDRVCQRRNNYTIDALGVFNGDTGVISNLNPITSSLDVTLWDGRIISYQKQDLNQLSLAYAQTIHRSQGSETPCVVLVLHPSNYILLERQLVYTAVTRAKEVLIIVGSEQALQIACERNRAKHRNSLLKRRLNLERIE